MDRRIYREIGALILSLALILNMIPLLSVPVFASAGNGDAVIAFTSDVHNEPAGEAAERLDNWIDAVNAYVGGSIDFMTFCGDMGRSKGETQNDRQSITAESYWSWAQAAIDVADGRLGKEKTAYTTGNHEFEDGNYNINADYTTGTQSRYSVDKVVKQTDTYEVYCLGCTSSSQNGSGYSDDQKNKLQTYLNSRTDSGKIYFIATHFPLHMYGSRSTKNARNIIDTINSAVEANNIDVVFIWGHNHSDRDTNYNTLYKPGDSITDNNNKSVKINFYYSPAGCMSDSENSTGNGGSIAPKGVMFRIPANGSAASAAFFDKNFSLINSEISIARKAPATYSVKYEANDATGGTVPTDSTQYEKNASVTVKGNTGSLVRTGYTFGGWRYNNITYKEGDKITISSNVTLTALWNANSYTVRFAKGEGSVNGSMSDQSFKYDETKALTKNTFTREGFTFTGWKDENGNAYTDGQSVSNLTASAGGVVTLTAQWKDNNKFTVTYNAGTGTSGNAPSDTNQYTQNAYVTVMNSGTLVKTGYTFGGWTSGGTTYQPGQTFQIRSDTTLTAVWDANSYTVKFTKGDGNVSGSMSDQSFIYDETKALTKNAYIREGFTFTGWRDASGKTYTDGQSVSNLTASAGGVVTLTAQWSAVYSVTYDAGGGTGTVPTDSNLYKANDTVTVRGGEGLTRTGYTFGGWRSGNTTYTAGQTFRITASTTLTAVWNANSYKVRFDKGSADARGTMNDQSFRYDETKALTRNAYSRESFTFTGWKDADGKTYGDGQSVSNLASANNATVVLTAQWAENSDVAAARSAANDQFSNAVSDIYLANYKEEQQQEIRTLADTYSKKIQAVITAEAIYALLSEFNDELSKIKTSAVIDMEGMADSVIDMYVDSQTLAKYKPAQQKMMKDLAEDYRNKIAAATGTEQIRSLLAEFESKAAVVPTSAAVDKAAEEKLKTTVQNKAVTIKSAKAGKKKATVTWAADPNVFDGYQIAYRIKGKKWKSVNVNGGSASKKVIKKLKKGKKYQVKVRGYKMFNGSAVYGVYSKTKTSKKIK